MGKIKFRNFVTGESTAAEILEKTTPFALKVCTRDGFQRICNVKWDGQTQEWVEV